MNGLAARRATRADLPRLLELLADDVLGKHRDAPGDDDARYHRAFDAIDRDPNQHLMVVEHDGRIVGMAQLTFIPGLGRRGAWRANIEAVRVDSAVRNRGIGAWMIEHAVALARERGCTIAQLTTDQRRTDAHRFYARLGFQNTHVGFKLAIGG